MKVQITNNSLQAIYIVVRPNGKPEERYIKPNQTLVVDKSALSEQILNLQRKKVLKIVDK